MTINRALFGLTVFIITIGYAFPKPGGGHKHVHHRIHVPQQIKTVYRTKIIKVPEHHHHFHEKEKIIIQKEEPKKEYHEYPPLLEEEEEEYDWRGSESSQIFKKKRYARPSSLKSTPKAHKKRRIIRPSYPHHKKRV